MREHDPAFLKELMRAFTALFVSGFMRADTAHAYYLSNKGLEPGTSDLAVTPSPSRR